MTRLEPCGLRRAGGAGSQTAEPCPACLGRPARQPPPGPPGADPVRGLRPDGLALARHAPGAAGGERGRPCRIEVAIPPAWTPAADPCCGEGTRRRPRAGRPDRHTRVRPHPIFSRKGITSLLRFRSRCPRRARGADPDPDARRAGGVTVPAGTQTGQTLRVRGKAVPGWTARAGDLLVQTRVVIPRNTDPALEEVLHARAAPPEDPRAGLWPAPDRRGARAGGGR
jgi:DnaJ-class molecular chaperone